MINKKITQFLAAVLLFSLGAGQTYTSQISSASAIKIVKKYKYDYSDQKEASRLKNKNHKVEKKISSLDKKIADLQKQLKHYTNPNAVESLSKQKLSTLNYEGKSVVNVNNNNPDFSKEDLDTSHGAWQKYGDLDSQNRVTAANTLLNKSLMPKTKREALHVNPTGWHNKKINHHWLFNRSHLIGYQLTGQNNNWKNLMTGTRHLNDPDMLMYENEVATYLKSSPTKYVRYRVTPIFRNNELLARGVEMEGQSINSNDVHFHVYIFNVQDGVTLDYNTGNSKIS